ncbi:hypothetical protein SAMN05216191_12837 [Paenibacillus jilunlii]|uniref:Uncharacterized protein n=1 Tax=Paenibacillus jilunlii TaxID=682956 RepID=A0A1G9YUS4_9BACL|nr:hypothetical protein SAMN05216191_12837 [Paenibacillus jilunlii]
MAPVLLLLSKNNSVLSVRIDMNPNAGILLTKSPCFFKYKHLYVSRYKFLVETVPLLKKAKPFMLV